MTFHSSTITSASNRQQIRRLLTFLLWSTAFGISFTQWPLYSENQNTKFLIGLANAGFGDLSNDWLANTVDPLPAFSALVYLTYRFLHPYLFYAFHALLLGTYLWSVGEIACATFPLKKTAVGLPFLYVILIALHASLVPPFSLNLLGTSLGWILQAGVANQYLFNPVLQPSTFGILLVLAIALYLQSRLYWAVIVASFAAIFHSTYLPAAAVLVAAFCLLTLWDERSIKRSLVMGLTALLLVTPVLLYNAIALGPTSAELWAQSQEIIVNFRIPHHSIPERWLDQTVYVKLGIVALALVATFRTRLFPILFISACFAVGLTLLQMRINWDTLAFIAPWRISVYLVPLSTAMIFARILSLLLNQVPEAVARYRRPLLGLSFLLLALLIGRGALAIQDSFAARAARAEARLWQFGQETRQPGYLYLVPTGMAEFRLETGIPVVVTFKSHPYKDVEVIEWRERVEAVNQYYQLPTCDELVDLAGRYAITHVVLQREQFFDGCDSITNVHLDDRYGVFQLE